MLHSEEHVPVLAWKKPVFLAGVLFETSLYRVVHLTYLEDQEVVIENGEL